jgi:excisionase family DNA binding protein
MTTDTAAAPTYLSARDAAARCGVSERTIRRWIVRSRLVADKDGREFRISPEALEPFIGHAADNGQAAAALEDVSAAPLQQGAALSVDTSVELVRLVDRLQRENLELGGRIGYLQSELQHATATIKALQAPAAAPIQTRRRWLHPGVTVGAVALILAALLLRVTIGA